MTEADNLESGAAAQHQSPGERIGVGEFLRRAREARGLTVEAVARGLKLSPTYIEALEAERFSEFAAQPYVRIYLQAVAKHLAIDPVDVLNRYRQQLGLTADNAAAAQQEKVDVSMRAGGQKTPWLPIVLLVGALAVIAFVAKQLNVGAPVPARQSSLGGASDTGATVPAHDSVKTNTAPSRGAVATGRPDTVARAAADTAAPVKPEPVASPAPSADSLVLVVTAVKDSVWVNSFSDGKPWTDVLHKGKVHTFHARDSLAVHVGYNAALTYVLNGKEFKPSVNKGAAIFVVNHKGTIALTQSQWQREFGKITQ